MQEKVGGALEAGVGAKDVILAIIAKIGDLLPFYKRLIGKAFDRIPEGKFKEEKGVVSFKDLLRTGNGAKDARPTEGQPIEILYTGGTTKHPKGVPINHALFVESVKTQLEVAYPIVPPPTNTVLQGGPLFHILGQVFGLGPVCVTGDTVVIMPRVNIDAFLYAVEHFKIKTFFGVPALFRMILEHDRLDFYNLSSLVYCFSGGDVLPTDLGRRWLEKFGHPIRQGYGATETCGGVAMCPVDRDNPSKSVGRVVASKKAKLVDPIELREVPTGEPGELLVSSRHMVKAYLNKPEETAAAFVQIDGETWYRTADIMSMDAEGNLYFVDRTVDTIKHKGYRVAASKVDNVLQEHHAVVASCTIGVPDPSVGERIKSYVVVRNDVKGVHAQDLVRFCKERLAPYEVPQYVEFRDMLPKSKVGKILRRELRSEEKRKAAG